MDIQVAWNNLVSAIEKNLWGDASEIADDILGWLAKDGLPPKNHRQTARGQADSQVSR